MKPRQKKVVPEIPEGLEPDGAHPVKQERSRRLRDKALDFARELVEQDRFASTSMAEIARAVGCSVGALYFRFHDKQALFASVIEVAMTREVEALSGQAAAGRYRGMPLRETVDRCVRDYISFIRSNEHMIRALYLQGGDRSQHWSVVRLAAYRMVNVWVEAVVQSAGRTGDRDFVSQVGIAFQFVSSTLVYTVLIEKPVRPLGNRELTFWLDEMVMHFIALVVPDGVRGTALARPELPPLPAPVPVSQGEAASPPPRGGRRSVARKSTLS